MRIGQQSKGSVKASRTRKQDRPAQQETNAGQQNRGARPAAVLAQKTEVHLVRAIEGKKSHIVDLNCFQLALWVYDILDMSIYWHL